MCPQPEHGQWQGQEESLVIADTTKARPMHNRGKNTHLYVQTEQELRNEVDLIPYTVFFVVVDVIQGKRELSIGVTVISSRNSSLKALVWYVTLYNSTSKVQWQKVVIFPQIFLVLWLWYAFLTFTMATRLVYRLVQVLSPRFRFHILNKRWVTTPKVTNIHSRWGSTVFADKVSFVRRKQDTEMERGFWSQCFANCRDSR